MGNVKSSTGGSVPPLERKRTTNKRAAGKTKAEESLGPWQPPGPRSYTSVDTELLGAGDRGKGERERVVCVCVCVSECVGVERRQWDNRVHS